MKAFTLLEISIVLILISLILIIGFSFLSFNKDFFYLRDISKSFSFSLNTASDMAQRVIEKNNNFFCAYGIFFPNSTSYEVLAFSTYGVLDFSTSTNLCEYIFFSSTSVNKLINLNLSSKNYILQNQEITPNLVPSLSLNVNLKPNNYFRFSTSTNNCSRNLLNPPLIFLYAYGYPDLYFLYQEGASSWNQILTDKIYICLEKNIGGSLRERYIIRVNKLGQISFER